MLGEGAVGEGNDGGTRILGNQRGGVKSVSKEGGGGHVRRSEVGSRFAGRERRPRDAVEDPRSRTKVEKSTRGRRG